ncbi:MAG TPA: ammonium transporter [Alphaproteobacteria bacterium]|nr:ammonium transporter [Alphaproteobacteria bacterium]
MKRHRMVSLLAPALGLAGLALPALAQDAAAPAAPASTLNSGDTAWMIVACALVLFMTIPGLALFYGGMVRRMNVLSTVMQSFAVCCLVSVLWMVAGYSLAFTASGSPFIGGLDRLFLSGMGLGSTNSLAGTIPEAVFMVFQMTFAIITVALITGAVADRLKFSALLWFAALWLFLVYVPVAHWVWHPEGFLFGDGVLDFAGGTVVHINAGIAGLVGALVLGKRRGYGTTHFTPHNLVLSVIGASMLWVGWFGFNAGSAVAANERAGMAMAVTQIAAAAAAMSWMFAEWLGKGKPSVLGIISGAVGGLVAITPASGFVAPGGALIIGLVSGVLCYFSATTLKNALGYDDSLDAFGVHGVGGFVGALLTGVFAVSAIGGDAAKGLLDGNPGQLWTQFYGCAVVIVYCAVVSFILFKVVDMIVGLRVSEDAEREGLDLNLHGEVVP